MDPVGVCLLAKNVTSSTPSVRTIRPCVEAGKPSSFPCTNYSLIPNRPAPRGTCGFPDPFSVANRLVHVSRLKLTLQTFLNTRRVGQVSELFGRITKPILLRLKLVAWSFASEPYLLLPTRVEDARVLATSNYIITGC